MPIAWKTRLFAAVIGRGDIDRYVTKCLRCGDMCLDAPESNNSLCIPLERSCAAITGTQGISSSSNSSMAAHASISGPPPSFPPPFAQHSALVWPFLWQLSHSTSRFGPPFFLPFFWESALSASSWDFGLPRLRPSHSFQRMRLSTQAIRRTTQVESPSQSRRTRCLGYSFPLPPAALEGSSACQYDRHSCSTFVQGLQSVPHAFGGGVPLDSGED